MDKFKADVVVFVHAAKRKTANEIVDRFAAAVEGENGPDLSFRFISSSDDTGEIRGVPDAIAGKSRGRRASAKR